jgi:hypothetical protein
MTASRYCVYQLENEWGEPFWVGCTRQPPENRYKSHLSVSEFDNPLKNAIIARMIDAKMRPAFVIVADNLPMAAAFELERAAIAKIGRRCLGTGPLTNIADGGKDNTVEGTSANNWYAKVAKAAPRIVGEFGNARIKRLLSFAACRPAPGEESEAAK